MISFIKKLVRNKKGISLLETIIALTILCTGLIGLVVLYTSSLSIMKTVSDRYVASYLAAEGIEIIKNRIDNDLASGQLFDTQLFNDVSSVARSNSDSYRFDPDSKKYIQATGRFRREINAEIVSGAIKANSIVRWTTSRGSQLEVNIEDYFYGPAS